MNEYWNRHFCNVPCDFINARTLIYILSAALQGYVSQECIKINYINYFLVIDIDKLRLYKHLNRLRLNFIAEKEQKFPRNLFV
jgi:hypothetical protein